ncbi:MAG: NupC/NupG family nucleoside CNT transporter [Thermoanaerobaculia bacterium]
MDRWIGLLGLFVLLGIAYLLSNNRKAINWRPVVMGTLFQVVFALIILKTQFGKAVFAGASDAITAFLDFTSEGSKFIFGEHFADHLFAFKVLPTIVFFSSFITVLYYFGVLQAIVKVFAWLMVRLMGTSGAESLSASANIFVGQTEAPLLIRPYVPTMTKSELMAVMVGGFATIAGGVMAAYVAMGISAGHLLAASVMSAPAALVMAKIMYPETEVSKTRGQVSIEIDRPWANVIDAAASGASDGLKLALNVGAMLLAFIALIAAVNALLRLLGGWIAFPQLSLEYLLGFICRPLAWVMGTPWAEADKVGSIIGIKTVVNEFVAYQQLAPMTQGPGALSAKAQVIAIYSLCGFSNFSSIAIQIGGIGSMAPERKADLAKLGLRAMVAGSLACFQTAVIAGLLL